MYSPPVVAAQPWQPQHRQRAAKILRVLPSNTDKFSTAVRQVQTALRAHGYYTEKAADGVAGSGTRLVIEKYQTDAEDHRHHHASASGYASDRRAVGQQVVVDNTGNVRIPTRSNSATPPKERLRADALHYHPSGQNQRPKRIQTG
ncbi:peptidoglycan-binding domain-containing protein [Pleomorphomonas koreensis]|uniref:peptidoglycan-binding domain-containing protein n=1 Tax=Pleomorphomonas koreensis TaxID=257440 RepID=UPI003CCC00D5